MTLVELALKLRPIIESAAQSLDNNTALSAQTLFPVWGTGLFYTKGFRVRYNNILYSVLQEHTSQDNWTPDVAASLFAKVLIPDETVVPEWEQPESTNPYMKGNRVTYNGIMYESLIDNNVWSPADYPAGWQEIR